MSEKGRQLPWKLWIILTLVGAGLTAILAIGEGKAGELSPLGWATMMIGFAPLIGAQLTLGVPGAAKKTQDWLQTVNRPLLHTAGGIAIIWLIVQTLSGSFNPYTTAIVAFGMFAALGALRQIQRGQRGLTWTDAAVWMLLWIPFDLRWIYDLGGDYNWWSIALSVLAVIGWYGMRELPEFGYRLVPRWRDISTGLIATIGFAAIVIPLGFAIHFITYPPTQPPVLFPTIIAFIGLTLTVAIPEELFFRGILLHGLDQMYQRRWLTLLVSSFLFGLMHWNNESVLTTQIAYVALATLAGLFYGWAYRRSGNNILAAVIAHALTDTVWMAFLK